MIQVSHLSHSYKSSDQKSEISLLENIDLVVNKGESLAILGKSGSGKSTLLSLLAGLERSSSGTISINQTQINNLSENELSFIRARDMGIVFQQFFLVSTLTALENTILPLKILKRDDEQALERAKDLLTQLGLGDRFHHLPSKLSGGESQRVAIARAMIHEPKIILADEPSGNLDQETGTKVMSELFSLIKKYGLTLVLVTHDLELANKCDRTIKLEKGKLH